MLIFFELRLIPINFECPVRNAQQKQSVSNKHISLSVKALYEKVTVCSENHAEQITYTLLAQEGNIYIQNGGM
jgi:hypothetical protein